MATPGGNGNGRPTGGGRGALLDLIKRQQAERERAAEQQAQQARQPQQVPGAMAGAVAASTSSGSSSGPSSVPSAPRGRAELLLKIQQQKAAAREQQPGDTTSTDSASTPPAPVGRAAMLKRLAEQKAQKQIPQPTPAPVVQQPQAPAEKPQSSTSATSDSSKVANLPCQLEKLSVEDSKTSSDTAEPIHKHGKDGKKINLAANYINISFEPGFGIFQYVVKFIPSIDSIQVRRKMLNQHLDVIGEVRNFDGALLYVPKKLQSDNISLSTEDTDGSIIQIQIIFKKLVPASEHMQFFNNLLRRVMSALELVPIGRQNFCPTAGHKLEQHKLELWPGYVTAISEVEGGLKLCIDATHRAIRTETVRDLLNALAKKNPDKFQAAAVAELIGTSVLTRYNNNKVYRIDDICFSETPMTEFMGKDGKKISLKEYYSKHWKIEIKDMKQPLLVHHAIKRTTTGEKVEQVVYLIPELCLLAGLTDSIRSDFKVMRDIAAITQVLPNKRRDTIRNFITQVNRNEAASKILSRWGIKMDKDIIGFEGRVLPSEHIQFGNCKIEVNNKASWSNEAVRSAVLETPNLNSWVILHVDKDKRTAMEFVKMLHNVKKSMQINISEPVMHVLRNDRTESYVNELRKVINDKLELVVIIFPSNRTDRYSAVKKICCAEMPIASQVIMSKTLSRPDILKGIVEKIALQINCKLGGTLWSLSIPLKTTMIVGVDVYHSGAGQKRASVVGFVASMNTSFTKWYSKTCHQNPNQEMIDVLKACFIMAISNFSKVNGQYPTRILMYRDGVGDGQLEHVKLYEVPQLIATFASIQSDYNPQLGVVIVQKRINTRLMESRDGSLQNVPPGTVGDREVTRRNYYDFYLVPQTANRGTVAPTHYIVLHDNSGLDVDKIQRLSYKLCHLYFNWPGTIKVPAPCQYAHKIAYLIGQNVQMDAHDALSNRLYYL